MRMEAQPWGWRSRKLAEGWCSLIPWALALALDCLPLDFSFPPTVQEGSWRWVILRGVPRSFLEGAQWAESSLATVVSQLRDTSPFLFHCFQLPLLFPGIKLPTNKSVLWGRATSVKTAMTYCGAPFWTRICSLIHHWLNEFLFQLHIFVRTAF